MDARGDTVVQIVRCARVLGRETNRNIRITETEQLYQVKRMIEGIGKRAVFDLFSNIKCVNSQGFSLVNL